MLQGGCEKVLALSLPLIPVCVAVPNPSLLPDPSLSSAEVWANVGPGQVHPADELILSHGIEEDRQQGDGVFVAQSLCIPRVLSPPCHLPEPLCHSGADVTYSSLPALAHPSQPSGSCVLRNMSKA